MKVLILGSIGSYSGPSNVHSAFLKHWPAQDDIDYVHALDRFGFIREGLSKGHHADVVISPLLSFPCICTQDALHAMGKPIVCFNHGYVVFENEINNLGLPRWRIRCYKSALRSADYVVANSQLQGDFVRRYQPELADRIGHILLGADRFERMEPHPAEDGPIVTVSGGSRYIKGNDIVARACSLINKRGAGCRLDVYGTVEGDMSFLSALPKDESRALGQVDHDRFLEALNQSSLFVMNSRHESFGLSALDAIQSGTSLLISKNCGVLEVLRPESSDVIQNCEDPVEVADKMEYVLAHPNGKRLYESLDWNELSWDTQVGRLRQMCVEVVERKRESGVR